MNKKMYIFSYTSNPCVEKRLKKIVIDVEERSKTYKMKKRPLENIHLFYKVFNKAREEKVEFLKYGGYSATIFTTNEENVSKTKEKFLEEIRKRAEDAHESAEETLEFVKKEIKKTENTLSKNE